MSDISSLIRFLKACYQADNRELSIFNFLGRSVQNRLFLNNSDLVEGKHEWYPIPTEWGVEMAKKLAIYGKEKQLILGAFYVIGKSEVAGERLSVCAPLILHKLELEENEEVFYLKFSEDGFRQNPSATRVLSTDNESDWSEELIGLLNQKMYLGFDSYHRIEKILKSSCSNLVLPEMLNLDHLSDDKELQKMLKSTEHNHFTIIPAIGVGLVNKQLSSRDLINELELLGNLNSYSPPMRELLLSEKSAIASKKGSDLYVPADLNMAQRSILKSTFQHHINVVIGPPGTGKSFTIASLAADCIAQGKSILITAQTDQAVDVIYHKIQENLGLESVVMRGGKRDYNKKLKNRIEQLIYGMGRPYIGMIDVNRIRYEVKRLRKKIDQLEDMINRREAAELNLGAKLFRMESLNWWERLVFNWKRQRNIGIIPVHEMVSKLDSYYERRKELYRKLVEAEFYYGLNKVVDYHWNDFKLFHQALKSRTGNKKDTLFEEASFDKITKAIPVWLASCNDVGKILPMQESMFDVVVVDEATQCNLASCLPVLQRGKHAVIVGDPKQLRHVSFLSGRRQLLMAKKIQINEAEAQRLDYRKKSLIDVALEEITSSRQVHFLDEHYRSLPDIIQFSNQHFYANALKVMSETPITKAEKNVFLTVKEGKRFKRGYNRVEAEAILYDVNQIIESERKLNTVLKQKIGILSPFREQVNYLQKKIEEQVSLEDMEAHQLLVGTPFHFQGEERDIMFLSFVVDKDTHPSTFIYLNRADVFNVSITRARIAQWVYTSMSIGQIKSEKGLFHEYVRFIQQNNQDIVPSVEQSYKDSFLEEVIELLRSHFAIDVFPNYTIGNQEIDILIVKDKQTYCIDLIGYPGPYGDAFPVERYRQLSRMGVPIFPLTYSSWCWEKENVEASLLTWIDNNN